MKTTGKTLIGRWMIAAVVAGWSCGAAFGSDPHADTGHADAGHGAAAGGNRFVRAEAPEALPAAGGSHAAVKDTHGQTAHGHDAADAAGHGVAGQGVTGHGVATAGGHGEADAHAVASSATQAAVVQETVSGHATEELEGIFLDLMAGNRRFVAGRETDRELLKRRVELVAGQHPKVAILSCADSRVPPELVFDKNIGELFVVRVAGNLSDPALAGSLEYAVEHLGVQVIVVLGHEKCGAVAAAASGAWMPSQNLHDIVKRIYPAIEEAKNAGSTDATVQSVANVRNTVRQLTADSEILAKAAEAGHVMIVPAIYRLGTGVVDRVSSGSLAEAAKGQGGATKVAGEKAASPKVTASTH
jgi:carbonic anhydrase